MCQDNTLGYLQEYIVKGNNIDDVMKAASTTSLTCPLARALHEYGMKLMPPMILSQIRKWLGTFGRLILSKSTMLQEHEMRVWSCKQQETQRINLHELRTTSKNVIKEENRGSNKFKWDELEPVSNQRFEDF